MAAANAPALRFQRAELREKADLSATAIGLLNKAPGPVELVTGLGELDDPFDAIKALVQILPHRQSVWWACLALRLLPDLAQRKVELAAVESAETWVQTSDPAAALRAGTAAEACDSGEAAYWAAMAAYWSGPSIAPPDQHAVPPAPHLPGVAVRTALLLVQSDPILAHRVNFADLLKIGLALMNGDLGRDAQAQLRTRLAGAS
jgi:hypothetical protein